MHERVLDRFERLRQIGGKSLGSEPNQIVALS
jgi:hypothetical protein